MTPSKVYDTGLARFWPNVTERHPVPTRNMKHTFTVYVFLLLAVALDFHHELYEICRHVRAIYNYE